MSRFFKKTLTLPLAHGKRYVTGEGKIVRVVGEVRDRPDFVHAGGMWFHAPTGKFLAQMRDGTESLVDGLKAISHDCCEVCEDVGGFWVESADVINTRWEVCQCQR